MYVLAGNQYSKVDVLPINTILEGNCLDILKQLPDNSVDACVTDPPYNISNKKGLDWKFSNYTTIEEKWDSFKDTNYYQFSFDWIREIIRIVKPNGNIFIFGSYHGIFTIGFLLQTIFDRCIISQIVWYKVDAQPNITCRMFTESTEFIIWAVNNENKKASNWTFNYDIIKQINNNKQMRNVWEIPVTKSIEKNHGKHPSQKPASVINRIILAGTNKGDIVIDPFSGSGTTGVICQQQGRNWIMIEKEREYNLIAEKRIQELEQQLF